MLDFLLVLLVSLAFLVVPGIWIYNRLVADRNQVQAAWSDIDVQLMRRHQLVPQLVETVKAYAAYEKATLAAVTELRSRSEAANHLPDKAAIEEQLVSALTRIAVVAEDYPDLKADHNFRQLQTELTSIEDHIQYARRFYNGAVRILNTRIQSFPHLLLARPLQFRPAEFFAANEAQAREPVNVELSS
ncbi:LemA family protein [Pseudohongiella acticola]|jgi:LemA protein|uniref:LemA family protein n=1 Tax=Pseudohongiella acticola TaxID=1524254 RepID=UPI0030EB9BDC